MKIPFYNIYSWLYKSFSVSSDTELIKELKSKKVKEAIVIKRSWLFGLFISWILIATSFLTIWNIYNVYKTFIFQTMGLKPQALACQDFTNSKIKNYN